MLNSILQNPQWVNIISWALFGLIVGLIVYLIAPGEVRGGIIGTLVTGILGALIGGFLSSVLLGVSLSGFNLQSILIALVGAFILAFGERMILRKNEHIKTPTGKVE